MKCVYTGQIIESIDDLEIDHIIPKSTPISELIILKKKYNLSDNFSIDSLENLHPTLKRFNQMKWKRPFSEATERFFIEIAKSKRVNIEKNRTFFRSKLRTLESDFLKLAIKERFSFESKTNFEIKKEIIYRDEVFMNHHYWNSKQKIVLNGFLPSNYDEKGSFIVEFKDLPTMFSLSHSDIIELIKQKNNISIKDLIFKGNSFKNQKSFITLGNNAVHLENDLFKDLVEILDDYLIEFERNYLIFEKFIDAKGYKKVKDSDYYILLETNREKWNLLIEYIKMYNFENGLTKNNRFYNNDNMVIALDKNYNQILFWLIPGQVENNDLNSFKQPDNKVNILWRVPSDQDRIKIITGEVWTFKQTLDFITEIINQLDAKSLLN